MCREIVRADVYVYIIYRAQPGLLQVLQVRLGRAIKIMLVATGDNKATAEVWA